jgi:hypothetical protein
MQVLNLFIHLSFRQGDRKCCCVVWCKKPLYKIKCVIIPTLLLQRIRQIMLPSAYWLLSLFKPVSKYNTAPFKTKKQLFTWISFQRCLEIHTFCAFVQSLPQCWLQMIYNWANNSITSKRYEQMYKCAQVTKRSSRFDLKTRASNHDRSCCKHSPVKIIQYKVNGLIHIWQWSIWI